MGAVTPLALRVAGNLLQAVSTVALDGHGKRLSVGASLGVAVFRSGGASLPAWLSSADAARYRAKAEGRGRVRLSPPPGGVPSEP